VQLTLVHGLLIRAIQGHPHHMAKDIRVEYHRDKDIIVPVLQVRVTQEHHLQDHKDIQVLGLRLDKDMEVHHLILRVTGVHHLHSKAMVQLHHHNKEDMVERPLLMLRYSNGSMLLTKTEVGRLTPRSSRGPLSMETGVTSVKRRAG